MFYWIIAWGVFIDLVSKYIVSTYLETYTPLLWDFLFLQYVENTGIAFSIQIPSILLKILTVILILGLFYYYKEEKKKHNWWLLDISFWLILAWAIGNAYERIINEKVVDFIGIKYFAVFNLADSFITIWALLYLYVLYKVSQNSKS